MAIYLDTCVIVAALTREPETDAALSFLSRSANEILVLSEWVATEFSCAISMKNRSQQLEKADRQRVLDLFAEIRKSLQFVNITQDHFTAAAKFADESANGLRAGDALHLAIVSVLGLTLCTFDRKFIASARALRIETLLP